MKPIPKHFSQTTLNRRDFLKLSMATYCTSILSGISGCQSSTPLKIACQIWPGYSFFYLARDQGLLPTNAIELIQTENLAASADALANGQVDGAALTIDEVIQLLDKGIALQIILVLDASAGADSLLVKPEIKKLSDLKGKRIGVESSNLGTIMLTKLLEASHLSHDDIISIPMNYDHLQAWNDQQLDGVISYDPVSILFAKKGLKRLWDSRGIPGLIVDVLAVRVEALEKQTKSLTHLVNAHFQAQLLWQKNPIDTTYLLAKILQIPPEEIKSAFMGIDLPDASFNRHYLSPPTKELKQSILDLSEIMIKNNLIKKTPNVDHLFTPDFIPGDL